MSFYVVSVYLIDRAYGGPEEGGWWYCCGQPEQLDGMPEPSVHKTREAAQEAREAVQAVLDDEWNKGRRSIDSVLSQGIYSAVIDEGHWPRPYPERTPHYE